MSLITGGNATMVPCVTNANPSQSLLGSGGGGGGSNDPNPSVSTLSVASGGDINISTLLTFNDASQTTPGVVNIRSGADFDTYFGFLGTGITGNLIEIVGSGNAGTQLELAGTTNGACAIGSLNTQNLEPSTLTLVADKIIMKNCDLAVSSINSGIPAVTSLFSTLFAANPTLSTIVY